MNKFIILAFVALAEAKTSVSDTVFEVPTTEALRLSVMKNQSIFWIGFLLPILALYIAYMLHADNEPNT
tara:strand:+ start:74 stop:280 length:207 start_codon:yes stop_codon:yes gene_type:complete